MKKMKHFLNPARVTATDKTELITRIFSFIILIGLIIVQTLGIYANVNPHFEMLIGFMLAMFLRG